MNDHWLHYRCLGQPKRDRKALNARSMQIIGQLPDDKYVVPELVREILDMEIPHPLRTKEYQLGDGARVVELEFPEEESLCKRALTQMCRLWAELGSK